MKEKLNGKQKNTSKVGERFKGNDLKPRVMKRILGVRADGTTNDWVEGDMVDEGDEDLLGKRARSKIRAASRNRTISQKRSLTPFEEVNISIFVPQGKHLKLFLSSKSLWLALKLQKT